MVCCNWTKCAAWDMPLHPHTLSSDEGQRERCGARHPGGPVTATPQPFENKQVLCNLTYYASKISNFFKMAHTTLHQEVIKVRYHCLA